MTKQSDQNKMAIESAVMAAKTSLAVDQIGKDVSEMKLDIKSFKEAKYVTQNDLQLQLKNSMDGVSKDFSISIEAMERSVSEIKDSIKWFRNVSAGAIVSILLFVVYAVIRGSLKLP